MTDPIICTSEQKSWCNNFIALCDYFVDHRSFYQTKGMKCDSKREWKKATHLLQQIVSIDEI